MPNPLVPRRLSTGPAALAAFLASFAWAHAAWAAPGVVPILAWLALPLVFIGTAAILAGPAEAVGRCFGQLDNLIAYRWDLIGSLTGIVTFTLLSWWQAPSVAWGILASAAYLTLLWGWRRVVAAVASAVTIACHASTCASRTPVSR